MVWSRGTRSVLRALLQALPLVVSPALRAQTPVTVFDSALAFYRRNQLSEAESLFIRAVYEDKSNLDAFLYLGETERRLNHISNSIKIARLVLKAAPCSSFGQFILAAAFDPKVTAYEDASAESTWVHAQAAVACDSSDGNAWLSLHLQALSRGDTALEKHALRRIAGSGFLAPAALAYARWVLRTLPPNALLLTVGDLDYFPARAVQVAEGVRPDVGVVAAQTLGFPWYARLVRDRFGVRLFYDDAALDSAARSDSVQLSDSIVARWRAGALRGDLGRPLAFAATGDVAGLVKQGPGLRLVGPYLTFHATSDTIFCDTAGTRIALGALPWRELGGPTTGVGDRSAIRLAEPEHMFALYALYVWVEYGATLNDAHRKADTRQVAADINAFATAVGLNDAYARSLLEIVHGWVVSP